MRRWLPAGRLSDGYAAARISAVFGFGHRAASAAARDVTTKSRSAVLFFLIKAAITASLILVIFMKIAVLPRHLDSAGAPYLFLCTLSARAGGSSCESSRPSALARMVPEDPAV